MTLGVIGGGAVAVAVACGLWWHVRRAPRRLDRLVRGGSRASRIAAMSRRGEPGPLVLGAGCAVLSAGAWVASGWVAAFVVAAYTGAVALAWRNSHRRRRAERLRFAALDAIGALTAEMRAGLPQPGALPVDLVPGGRDPFVQRAVERVEAAIALSQTLGAPLADLLDRIEHDLRAGLRLRALVAAQMSGARATGVLLAGLPIGGTALGAGLGASPLDTLLHTTLGAGCAISAVALQAAGLAWCSWLSRAAVEAVA